MAFRWRRRARASVPSHRSRLVGRALASSRAVPDRGAENPHRRQAIVSEFTKRSPLRAVQEGARRPTRCAHESHAIPLGELVRPLDESSRPLGRPILSAQRAFRTPPMAALRHGAVAMGAVSTAAGKEDFSATPDFSANRRNQFHSAVREAPQVHHAYSSPTRPGIISRTSRHPAALERHQQQAVAGIKRLHALHSEVELQADCLSWRHGSSSRGEESVRVFSRPAISMRVANPRRRSSTMTLQPRRPAVLPGISFTHGSGGTAQCYGS